MTLNWTQSTAGFKAVTEAFTYYIDQFHGDIHVSYADNTAPARKERGRTIIDLTHIKWGCTDVDEAKALAQTHANQNAHA